MTVTNSPSLNIYQSTKTPTQTVDKSYKALLQKSMLKNKNNAHMLFQTFLF